MTNTDYKKYFSIKGILTLCLFYCLISCNDTTQKRDATTKTGSTTLLTDSLSKHFIWEGTLGTKIPVRLEYELLDSIIFDDQASDGVVNGNVIYTNTKNKAPIKLFGFWRILNKGAINEHIFIELIELSKEGNHTGSWDIHAYADTLTVTWHNPYYAMNKDSDARALKGKCKLKKTSSKPLNLSSNINGHYHYGKKFDYYYRDTKLDEDEKRTPGYGDMYVQQINDSQIIFSCETLVYPYNNLAAFDTDTLPLKRNRSIHLGESFDDCNCVCDFTITFHNSIAIIEHTSNPEDCGFGHRGSLEGIYSKTQ